MSNVFVLDFETYYDSDYSLSKLATQSYVHDDRFQPIMLGWSINGQKQPIAIGDDIAHLLAALKPDMERRGSIVVAHNALFDGYILEAIYGVRPHRYWCTMLGARPYMIQRTGGRASLSVLAKLTDAGAKGTEVVNARGKRLEDFNMLELKKYAEYCQQDVEICWQLFRRQWPTISPGERVSLDLTIKKFTRPKLQLSDRVLIGYLGLVRREKQRVLEMANIRDPGELRSNDKFAALLTKIGVDPPKKISPKTGKVTYAFAKTDPGFIELLDSDRIDVAVLAAARISQRSTLAETRCQRMLDLAGLDAPFGVPLKWWGAGTGRHSGTDNINLQNLPKRGNNKTLRRAIEALAGYALVACDLAQIEARMLAWLADQLELLRLFATGGDPYVDFASEFYQIPADRVTPVQRLFGKMVILGLGYMMSWEKFYLTLRPIPDLAHITQHDTYKAVNAYRNKNTKIVDLWHKTNQFLRVMAGDSPDEYVRHKCLHFFYHSLGMPNGMSIQYPGLKQDGRSYTYVKGKTPTYLYSGKVVENETQALAGIVMRQAERRVMAATGHNAVFSVHDELVYAVPIDEAMPFAAYLEKEMARPVKWAPGLPLGAEASVGRNYADLVSINDIHTGKKENPL